jgi:large subunit ribosomal protein L21e
MVKRTGTGRRKTRGFFTKNIRKKGKVNISSYFTQFKQGEKALLKVEPAIHNGTYFRRFHGKIAEVVKKSGTCYEVRVLDKGKEKTLTVHPVHLRKVA